MKRKAEFYGKELVPGEVRTVFTVVVSASRAYTEDEIDEALWDGTHGKESTTVDFHVSRECSWGPIQTKP